MVIMGSYHSYTFKKCLCIQCLFIDSWEITTSLLVSQLMYKEIDLDHYACPCPEHGQPAHQNSHSTQVENNQHQTFWIASLFNNVLLMSFNYFVCFPLLNKLSIISKGCTSSIQSNFYSMHATHFLYFLNTLNKNFTSNENKIASVKL